MTYQGSHNSSGFQIYIELSFSEFSIEKILMRLYRENIHYKIIMKNQKEEKLQI